MVGTSAHLLYKCSSFETDEEKAKEDLTKQLLFWLTISSFQIFIALPVCSAFSKVQNAHHSLVISSAYIFLSTVLCKANLPFIYGFWAVCGHCSHAACSAAAAAITKTPLTLPARHISKRIYICLWLLCGFFFSSAVYVPHVAVLTQCLTQCFQHCFLWIIPISCRQSLCLFPLIIYGRSQHWALSAQNYGPGSKCVTNTPSPGFPFRSSAKGTLLWQTGALMLVGSGRWAAEEQHQPPPLLLPRVPLGTQGPLSAQGSHVCSVQGHLLLHTGDMARAHLTWPGLTLIVLTWQ